MKTLKHHVLIFDQNCPLCRTYTGAFVKTGMLDQNGRAAYSQLEPQNCNLLDMQRARNEIALLNTKTGQVIYGIDSLFRVISHSFPIIAPLFRLAFFRWIMKKIYSFISYNRKAIIPSNESGDACTPDFNLKYRWLYIVFTWFCTSAVLTVYSRRLEPIIPASKFFREFLVCGGQIVFQALAVFLILSLVNSGGRNRSLTGKKIKQDVMVYLGNMMTISFSGALVLFLAMTLGSVFHVNNSYVYAVIFSGTAGLMFLEHWRRMKLLEVHWFVSLSWVLYRVLLLYVII